MILNNAYAKDYNTSHKVHDDSKSHKNHNDSQKNKSSKHSSDNSSTIAMSNEQQHQCIGVDCSDNDDKDDRFYC